MSNQGLRLASVQAVTSTNYGYPGDFQALFDLHSIPAGDFNGRFLRWINAKLSPLTFSDLPSALQGLAAANGAYNFDCLGTFDASAP